MNVHFIFLFSLSEVSLQPALTHVIGYFLFGTLAPASTCVPTPIRSRRPWGCPLSGNSSLNPSTGCLGDLFRILLLSLSPPLSRSRFVAKLLRFGCPLLCMGWVRPFLVPCFVLSDALLAHTPWPSLDLPRPPDHCIALDLTQQKQLPRKGVPTESQCPIESAPLTIVASFIS